MSRILLLLLSTLCWGQQSAEIVPLQLPSHPQRAQVQPLLSDGGYTIAQGEQPAADVYKPALEVPLGTIARICREDSQNKLCIYKGDK